jgi:hypothetical protein
VQRATPSPLDSSLVASESASEAEDSQLQSGVRTPARSTLTLETVQEVSLPNSPGQGMDGVLEKVKEKLSSQLVPLEDGTAVSESKTLKVLPNLVAGESGSESGSVKADSRRTNSTVAVPPLMTRQSSAMSAKQGKTKGAGEGSAQHMTVETETVSSIPQVALAPASSTTSGSGTLKTKPSTETIKPKKEKKKTNRKQPPVAPGNGEQPASSQYNLRHHQSVRSFSGATDACLSPTKIYGLGPQMDELTSPRRLKALGARTPSLGFYQMSTLLTRPRPASSKADIFEAKVASAVDEANTSDSEETFVYDSNPPDGGDRPRRFHSRTPSVTSIPSQAERNAMRSIHSVMEGAGPPVTVKKNMKFVNTYGSNGGDSLPGAEDDGKGTGRSTTGSARGTARQHHHIGRWGRNGGGNGHASLFDNESPFPNAARSKLGGNNSRQSSGPPSPRVNSGRGATNGKRSSIQHLASGYDLDDTTGADDDERTPLVSGSLRSARSGRIRRNQMSLRQLEQQSYRQKASYLNRFAACLVVTMMILVFITGAIGFMFATSQPLTDIELVAITNVLASEPELMFDVTVRAHNPNIVVVTIDQANVEIFAKSVHAATDTEWRKKENREEGGVHTTDDPPDDPPDDDNAPNMRLGTILEFDSPLSFEGSFFHQGMSSSTGEMRLRLPGNSTAGGSERWDIIQQDEFDLIIKGVLRYSLPLSQRVRSAAISGRTRVKPNSANDPLKPNSTSISP